MPERAFEHLREALAIAAGTADRGHPELAYKHLSRSVRVFLEAWMAVQTERDEWADRQEQANHDREAAAAQLSYR